jgi:hypothetical protein
MENRTDTQSDGGTTSGPAPGGNGAGEKLSAENLRGLGSLLGELREYASYLAAAKADAVKFSLKKAAFFAVLGAVAGVAALALIATAAALLLKGFSGGLGVLLGDRLWLGDLIAGAAVLIGLLLGLAAAGGILKRASLKKTIDKYEKRQERQRERYGRGADEQAARRVDGERG